MVNYVMLDERIANAFTPLYQGDLLHFTDEKHFAYGAVIEGEPVGLFAATIEEDYSSVDWIYVKEEHRGGELGKRMLKGGVRIISEMYGEDYITVCCTDEALKGFFEHCGFVFKADWVRYSYRGNLKDMKEIPEVNLQEHAIYSLSQLSPEDLNGLNLYFESLRDTEIGMELPIKKEDYLDTPAVFIKNDLLRAVLLLKEESGDEISIAYAYAFEHDGYALILLIQEAKKAIVKEYGEDKIISTASLGDNTDKMLEYLFPSMEKTPVFFGSYEG